MADWIIAFIEDQGYLGIAALMLAENLFPPIPSELIMPFAGFAAARGQLQVGGVVFAGVAGSLIGALPWYWAGRAIGRDPLERWAARNGRWLAVSPADIERAERWFERHGEVALAVGRLVPTVRSVVSVPAGISRMPLPRFLLWSLFGTALWTGALTALGVLLEDKYVQVARWLNPVSTAIVVLAVAAYLYRVFTFARP